MNIAVSMRVVQNAGYPEIRDAISHDWIRLLSSCGVAPILIPNADIDPVRLLKSSGSRGLLLTGGDDLTILAGAPAGDARDLRDRTEATLLTFALENDLPVLGVCRGLQAIHAAFGGTLRRDLRAADPGIGNHVGVRHEIEIVEAPCPGLTVGARVLTNSYHAQGVLRDELAAPLRAFALAPGGVVEGLYAPGRPVLAVQWHPERDGSSTEIDQVLLSDWLGRCA